MWLVQELVGLGAGSSDPSESGPPKGRRPQVPQNEKRGRAKARPRFRFELESDDRYGWIPPALLSYDQVLPLPWECEEVPVNEEAALVMTMATPAEPRKPARFD